jgi:hypothetical protein
VDQSCGPVLACNGPHLPKNYSATDSDTIRELSEGVDFLISVRPDAAIAPTVEVFKDVINEHGERLRSLYGITSDELRNEPGRQTGTLLMTSARTFRPDGTLSTFRGISITRCFP